MLLLALFLCFWIWSAINPLHPEGWLNENYVVFAGGALLIFLIKYFKLSDVSVTLITAFVIIHIIATHYTYLEVPFGFTLQAWLGASRNMYDRFAHFFFGFLFIYPLREIIIKLTKVKGIWSYIIPIEIVLSTSAFFEILEFFVASVIRPDSVPAFMGFQNDFFDTTKDMLNAFSGALLATLAILIVNLSTDKGTKKEIKQSLKIKNGKKAPEEKEIEKLIKKGTKVLKK